MHLCLCKNNHYSFNCIWEKVISKIHDKDKNKISIAFFVHSQHRHHVDGITGLIQCSEDKIHASLN